MNLSHSFLYLNLDARLFFILESSVNCISNHFVFLLPICLKFLVSNKVCKKIFRLDFLIGQFVFGKFSGVLVNVIPLM